MQNFYTVLGVGPQASEAEIKTAFRNLAKTCHPDMKPGDSGAEAVFQEVKRAYTFLSNPETRKVYDAFLASQRAVERRRFRRAAATMSASFLLTAATVFAAMFWIQHAGARSTSELTAPELPAAAKALAKRAEAVTERPSGP